METKLLRLFVEFYEKQDIVQKQTTKAFIHEYGHSDLHCVDVIGKNEFPNVTLISQALSITRGAASKITKRLMTKGDISSFQTKENKKEVYYALTAKGEAIFEAHRQRHEIWEARDIGYLNSISLEEKEAAIRFLAGFNQYLQQKIEELEQEERINI